MLSFLSSRPEILWIHAASDLFLALAFFAVAAASVRFLLRRRPDSISPWGVLFAVFFLFAGLVHGIHLAAPWYPVYVYEGVLKAATALFSAAAAILVWRWIPKMLDLPHPAQIQEKIAELEEQAAALKNKEDALGKEILQLEMSLRRLPSLMKAIDESSDFHAALEAALHQLCEITQWEYGESWIVAGKGKVLDAGPAWHGSERFEKLRRLSRELKFPPEMGLEGRVWASRKPQMIPDVGAEPKGAFVRVQWFQEAGLKAAFGVPVISGDKVLAVLIFGIRNFQERDKVFADLISAAAVELGGVIQRKIFQRNLKEAEEQVEKKIRERTKELIGAKEALEAEIAEHEKLEAALRSSQENFSTMVNSIDGIVWEYDLAASKFTFVSEQAERMLGYPVAAWSAEPSFWQDHIHGGDRAEALAFRARAAAEKKNDRFEYRMITADGRTIWFRDLVTVVVEKEEAVKLRGVMVNITESKQVEEALSQERNFVSAVFETASALVMVLDTEGKIVRFNRACEQISGYSTEEARGKSFWDLFSVPEEVTKSQMIFTRLLAGQFPINDESDWVAKDGSRRAIAWSHTALLNKYGAVIHVIATGVDITRRKEVEQKLKEAVADLARSNAEMDKYSRELQDANQRLRELDEIKSHFISAASHELRTPLTSIKGYVESVLEEEAGALNEKQKEFLGYVKTSTDRLHRLLNELLDISKIESGQVKMNKDLTNLRELLKEEVMIFKAQAQNKKISLDLATDMHLREIFCDADKIKEVMDNLISNAVKYTPSEGRIKIEARNSDGGVRIDVQDTGIGIAKEDLGRIFEPFQHIEKNGTADEESTGLGLTLVKRIVDAHEGTVQVRSEEGRGSTFSVTLPVSSSSGSEKSADWALSHHE